MVKGSATATQPAERPIGPAKVPARLWIGPETKAVKKIGGASTGRFPPPWSVEERIALYFVYVDIRTKTDPPAARRPDIRKTQSLFRSLFAKRAPLETMQKPPFVAR
jgi:hypothetical protein